MSARLKLLCVTIGGAFLAADVASAQTFATPPTNPTGYGGIDVKAKQGNPAVTYDVAGGNNRELSDATTSHERRRSLSAPSVVYVTFPALVTQPDGSRCVRVQRRGFPSAVSAAAATDAQDALWRMAVASFPLCQRTPAPPDSTPAQHAADFWRVAGEDLLPEPVPRIAPGYMLAGKTAYLEAGTVPSARFEHPTPLGTLAIEATGQVFVDWGDGSAVDGPYDSAGGPWPDGRITHFWTTASTYDVRVLQRWTGRWQLGDDGGELAGLVTEGRIDDFEVRQLQAVRNW